MSNLGNKEVMAKNIQYYMDKKRIDRKKLSTDLSISYTTLTDWLKAKTYPRIDKIEMLANYFSISKADLVEEKRSSPTLTLVTDTTAKLEEPRKKVVLATAQSQLQEQEQEQEQKQQKSNVINVSFGVKDTIEDTEKDIRISGKMTAGYGTINFDKAQPLYTITMNAKDVPYGYDLAFEVSGDSMYPTFENGEIIFVKETTEVTNGMIGCVEINRDAFIKKMYVEDGRLRLVSLNNDYDENGDRIYPDFYADDNDEIYIIGKVVM